MQSHKRMLRSRLADIELSFRNSPRPILGSSPAIAETKVSLNGEFIIDGGRRDAIGNNFP